MKNQQSTGSPYILSSVMMFENSFQPGSVRLIQASQNADITRLNRANGWVEADWGPDIGSSGHRELLNRYADQPRQQFGGFRQGVPEVTAPRLPGKAPFQALAQALHHCRTQGKTPAQFLRQFHQWFDAFRTLKFVHGIRDAGWPAQNLSQLAGLAPGLWPAGDTVSDYEALRCAVRRHWGWKTQ